ncbi:hypothetical protein BS329_03580 [Amycolatopsis coloradensis]|uniref:CdiI immunity protein domain-containing protein n=1 Tax=Amycolatopsis coloradensis TaxID=76021 RepID=A0A1R0KZX7_9PSEU|nr:hypothetical protein [Amycolatopsis coloradensis]OLZ55123.1 hypothetical protein BS329_03580 [Amycolatopsis coloradensis]
MNEQLERWKLLRRLAADYLWRWDIYGVGEDRQFAPTEYDDWAEDLTKVLMREPTRETVRAVLARRIAEDGISGESLGSFDIDGLLAEIGSSKER